MPVTVRRAVSCGPACGANVALCLSSRHRAPSGAPRAQITLSRRLFAPPAFSFLAFSFSIEWWCQANAMERVGLLSTTGDIARAPAAPWERRDRAAESSEALRRVLCAVGPGRLGSCHLRRTAHRPRLDHSAPEARYLRTYHLGGSSIRSTNTRSTSPLRRASKYPLVPPAAPSRAI